MGGLTIWPLAVAVTLSACGASTWLGFEPGGVALAGTASTRSCVCADNVSVSVTSAVPSPCRMADSWMPSDAPGADALELLGEPLDGGTGCSADGGGTLITA